MVTLTLPQLEGVQGRLRPKSWGGCSRGVLAIRVVKLTLSQVEGAKERSRAQSLGWCRRVFFFAASELTLTLSQLEGAWGASALKIRGDAVGVCLKSRS